jgi:polysaccharide pyruvyl transferase WcaK-like protein
MQSKTQSAIEVVAGTTIGFIIAMIAQVYITWQYGISSTLAQDFGITVFFTGISIIRGYAVRRFFNWLASRALTVSIPQNHDPKS